MTFRFLFFFQREEESSTPTTTTTTSDVFKQMSEFKLEKAMKKFWKKNKDVKKQGLFVRFDFIYFNWFYFFCIFPISKNWQKKELN